MIETINNYDNLRQNIAHYINISGYKQTFLAEKIGLNKVSFSQRKNNGNFTFEQIKKLAKYLFSDEYSERAQILTEIINKSTLEIESGEFIPNSEVKRSINA